MTELLVFLWALYIGTMLALLVYRWFEALRESRGQVPFLTPAWERIKGWVERLLRLR